MFDSCPGWSPSNTRGELLRRPGPRSSALESPPTPRANLPRVLLNSRGPLPLYSTGSAIKGTIFTDSPCPPRKKATSIRSIKSLVPLLDRVLVQRIKAETKTASGIFLPESSVKELNEGKVLAVGPGALDKEGKRLPVGVQAGDRVLIPTVRRPWEPPMRNMAGLKFALGHTFF